MSRFELYGKIKCDDCGYYRKSSRCPVYRCDHPDNKPNTNWIGPIYMRRPDDINWKYKCKWYKEKE